MEITARCDLHYHGSTEFFAGGEDDRGEVAMSPSFADADRRRSVRSAAPTARRGPPVIYVTRLGDNVHILLGGLKRRMGMSQVQ